MSSHPSQFSILPVEPSRSSSELRDDDPLLQLFWNRAELKKEFARLRAEKATLKDRIRHQEGQLLRAQQRLEQLEGLLADPAQAVQLALYYQLRALWGYGRRRLARLAREQTQRELNEEQRARLAAFAARQQTELAELDQRLRDARSELRAARQDLHLTRRRFAGLRGWFRRAEARLELSSRSQTVETATARLRQLQDMRNSRAAETLTPESQLSVAGRRRVNLAVIALAQELVVHLEEGELADRARDSSARRFLDVDYGNAADCRKLSRLAARRLQDFEAMDDLATRLELRTRYLTSRVQYRREQDTVPVGPGLDEIPRDLAGGRDVDLIDCVSCDVLAGDYWELYSVLVA